MAEPATTASVTLKDGREVDVRPIRPEDAPALQRFHSRLSPWSIYQRFFEWKPVLDEAMARYFTNVDGVNRYALVALDPEQPSEIIAVVRYDLEPGTDLAEYAAVVEDRWQGHRLGLQMTRLLIEDARRNGACKLYAYVLQENRPMTNLLTHLGLPVKREWEGSTLRIEVDMCPE